MSSIDFESQEATIECQSSEQNLKDASRKLCNTATPAEDGIPKQLQFDLLVGADGSASVVCCKHDLLRDASDPFCLRVMYSQYQSNGVDYPARTAWPSKCLRCKVTAGTQCETFGTMSLCIILDQALCCRSST